MMIMSVTVMSLLAGMIGIAFGASPKEIIAIKGYDTVAYFTVGKAAKGTEDFTFSWHNMTWFFQSKENLDLFAASPEKYAPQYDGWCAWAMTEARKAVTDPEVWKIVDGRLFLNNNPDSAQDWSENLTESIQIGDTNWRTASR